MPAFMPQPNNQVSSKVIIMLKTIQRAVNLLGVSVLAGLTFAPVVNAYDTDIYFSNVNTGAGSGNNHGKQPNILMIMDTSGSMRSRVSSGAPTRLSVMQAALNNVIDNSQNVNMGLARLSRQGGAIVYPVADLNADAGLVEMQATNTLPTTINPGPFTTVASVNASNGDAKEVLDLTQAVSVTDTSLPTTTAFVPGTISDSISVRLNGSENDGVERVGLLRTGDGGDISNVHLFTGAVQDGSSAAFLSVTGLRFEDLPIPPGSLVTNAEIVFTNSRKDTGEVEYEVSVENNVHAAPFRADSDGITKVITAGGAKVLRDDSKDQGVFVPWGVYAETAHHSQWRSPDISELLNRVISDPSWDQNDNAVALFMWPRELPSVRDRRPYSADHSNASRRPLLEVDYTNTGPQPVQHALGFHFDDIRIPQGAKINSVHLRLTAAQPSDAPVNVTIYAENTDDASPFVDGSTGSISSRPKTVGVSWSQGAADGWASDSVYSTADLTPALQQVVNRSGWCGGNGLGFIIEGVGARAIATFDDDPAKAPQLVVEYENDFSGPETGCTVSETSYQITNASGDAVENATTDSVATALQDMPLGSANHAGFNFTGVLVPQGAVIENAALELTSSAAGSATTRIYAHDVDSSATFSASPENISSRSRTSDSVLWSLAATAADQRLVSSDIKDVIAEVIDRPGWLSGGDISLILMSDSGSQEVKAFEDSVFNSARLKIRHQFNMAAAVAGASGVTVRQRLKEMVNQLPASGGTPATDTLHEAIRYLRGETVNWGRQRVSLGARNNWPNYSDSTKNYFSSFKKSFSATYSPMDAAVDLPAGCPGEESSDIDCGPEHITASPLPSYVSPIVNGCQKTHVVLLSDGAPNGFAGRTEVRALTGTSCSGDNACGGALANYMSNEDLLPSIPGVQTAKLHTIGLQLDNAYMTTLASEGQGSFYLANNADQLLEAFESIVAEAVDEPQTFTAPSVAASAYNQLQVGSDLFFSMFMPHVTKGWNGNIKRYKFSGASGNVVDKNNAEAFENGTIKNTATSYWSSEVDGNTVDKGGFGERLIAAGHAARNMYTYTPASVPVNADIITNANELRTNNPSAVGMSAWPASLSNPERQLLISWMRGMDTEDTDSDNDQTDTRWSVADPLHSQPVAITYDGGADPADSADDNVSLFVGTNAGVIHAINAATGDELWSFVPPEMLPMQEAIRDDLQGTHEYGVDGRITAWVKDVNQNGDIRASEGDQVILYVPFGRGARALYALDVTAPNTPKILWRITPSRSGYANLGQTWSHPQVRKMKIGGSPRDVLIMGGGYDPVYDAPAYGGSAGMGRGVYIIDANSGDRLLWISSDSSASLTVAGMNSAIPSDIAVVDLVGPDGWVDRLYFADLLGRLWRVDLTNVGINNPGDSVAHLVADLNGSDDEDGRRFFNPPLVVPFQDDGHIPQYLFLLLTSGDIHNPLEKQTLNAAFAIKDSFQLLDESDLPDLLTPVEDEANTDDGILNVTRFDSENRPTNLPHGYYFNFIKGTTDNVTDDVNVGRVGLSSGRVKKQDVNYNIDFTWQFAVFDPSLNSGAVPEQCSSAVVGATVLYEVILRDGFPTSLVGEDPSGDPADPGDECADCAQPDNRIADGEFRGIGDINEDNTIGDNSVCAKLVGFQVVPDSCPGENLKRVYWWRSRR